MTSTGEMRRKQTETEKAWGRGGRTRRVPSPGKQTKKVRGGESCTECCSQADLTRKLETAGLGNAEVSAP